MDIKERLREREQQLPYIHLAIDNWYNVNLQSLEEWKKELEKKRDFTFNIISYCLLIQIITF